MATTPFVPTHQAPPSGLLAWNAPESNRVVTGNIAGGTVLEVLERRGTQWARVRRADGFLGWVEAQGLQSAPRRAGGRLFAIVAAIVILALLAGAGFLLWKSRGTVAKPPNQFTSTVSAAALLATAYENGSIDRPTWLRYRAYSMFGVQSLPAQYRQGTPNQDDASLAAELQLGDPLPADVHAELMSFLGRPANPGSVFYGKGPVQAQYRAVPHATLMDTAICDRDRWTWRDSETHFFRVWAKCTEGYSARIDTVTNILDGLWPDETGLMGLPADDTVPHVDPAQYGGDGATDIYLVPRNTTVTRNGQTVQMGGLDGADTVAAPPFTGNSSSGYILLDESAPSQPGLRSLLAHELFHLLEYAHNYKAHWERAGLLHGFALEENWFAEASAVWAESYFARSSAPSGAYQRVDQFLQNTALPLDARGATGGPEWLHGYQDFMWLIFMEQEAGRNVIGDVWKSSLMTSATTGAQATAAFDESFPFAKHFHTFALRNLDDPALTPAIGRTYQDLDQKFPSFTQATGAKIPSRSGSMFVQLTPGDQPGSATLNVSVDHLSARYYDITFGDGVNQVTWDLSSLAGIPNVEANLVVLPVQGGGAPTLLSLPFFGTKPPTLCDVQTKIQSAILVVSNADVTVSASGSITAKGVADACESTPKPAPALVLTGVSPSRVAANDLETTLKLSGQGFSQLDPASITIGGNPVLTLGFLPGGGLEKNTVVSDSELDVTVSISSENSPGVYDLSLGGTIDGASANATCKGCLTITRS